MNIIERIARTGFEGPDAPEVTRETQYGVAYWTGKEILEDYARDPGGLDTLYRHTVANYGESNVTLVTRQVITTRVTGCAVLAPPPPYDCDACGQDTGDVRVFVDPQDSDEDQVAVALCEGCKSRPQNDRLVQVVA